MLSPVDETTDREYLWKGRGGPIALLLSERVFAPTHTSQEVAEGLVVNPGDTVIEVGAGSGILSFVAAKLGAARVFGTEVNGESVRYAGMNAERLGLADRIVFRLGSLFEPLKEIRANVVIGDVSGIPDDIAAVSGWFPGGYSGGPTRAGGPIAKAGQAPGPPLPAGRPYTPPGSTPD